MHTEIHTESCITISDLKQPNSANFHLWKLRAACISLPRDAESEPAAKVTV